MRFVLKALGTTLLMAGAVMPAFVSRAHTEFLQPEQASSQAEARELVSGAPVEREIKVGESHSYRLKLGVSQYAHISVNQRGIDLSIAVFGSDAQRITDIDRHYGLQETEHIYLVAESAGDYTLEVRPVEPKAPPGRYEIRIQAVRAASPEDKSRFAAQKAFAEGGRLARERKTESLRKAIDTYEEAFALWKAAGDNEEQARSLNNIGLTYHALKESQKAIDYYVQSLPLWKASGDRSGEASSLYSIGTIYSGMGQRQKGLEYLNLALPLRRAVNDKFWEGNTLISIGRAHEALGEYQKAIESYKLALQIKRDVGDRAGEGGMLFSLGVVDYYQGEYQRALDYYNQSLLARRDAGDRNGEGSTLSAIGVVHTSRGEFPEALEHYDRAIRLLRESGNRQAEGLALHNLAAVYSFVGDSQRALDYYNQALKLRKEAGDRQGEAQTLSNLGNFYSAQGDQEKALEFFNESLPIRRAMGDRRGEGYTINNMGTAHLLRGENKIALDLFNQALTIFQAIGDRDGQPIALIGIGKTYSAFGDREKALDSYGRALPLFRASGSRRLEGDTLDRIGSAYVSLGDNEKALAHYNQAIAIAQAIGSRDLEARSVAGLARVESNRNRLAEARAHIEAALDITESLRAKVASQDLRASFLASKQNDYEFYIDLLMRLHTSQPAARHDGAALLASERARARSLLEILTEARADIRQGIDSQLLERERRVQQQLNAKSETLTRLLSGKHTDQQAEVAKKEVSSILAEYQDLQGQIRSRSPRYAALTQPAPLSLKEIQQQVLDPETMLLEYSLGKERSYLWAVTPTSMKSFELPGRAEIEVAAGRFHELVSQGDKIELRAQVKLAAQNLSRIILAPVASQLSSKRLLIVADGALQYVPFGALPKLVVSGQRPVVSSDESRGPARLAKRDGQKPGNKNWPLTTDHRPLIADHEIVTLPSASVLTLLRREIAGRQIARKQVAVLADPVLDNNDPRVTQAAQQTERSAGESVAETSGRKDLTRSASESGVTAFERLRYTRQEADSIIALAAPGTGLSAVDFQASRATATGSGLSQYRIVHFATHGLINSRHPELSGIVLSLVDEQGKPQDGFLRLHDIYNLKLGADMVVLSACRTALGKEVRGEGLIGLTRGFMYAGAPRVVASLWDVRDEATAQLMKRFYEGMLRQGMTPAAALRAAQISMTKEKRWEAPYYWAGFVLQGEWR